jgi:hypothetical protein
LDPPKRRRRTATASAADAERAEFFEGLRKFAFEFGKEKMKELWSLKSVSHDSVFKAFKI